MKIREIRTGIVQWKGETARLPPHFRANPVDVVWLRFVRATMSSLARRVWKSMKRRAWKTALSLAFLATAVYARADHPFICTDSHAGPVRVVSTDGKIQWEY